MFLGNEGAGKTSLIARYIYDDFCDNCDATIGIDFFSKSFVSEESVTRLQIWDTAGQEHYRCIIGSYVRDVSIAFVVYDVTS